MKWCTGEYSLVYFTSMIPLNSRTFWAVGNNLHYAFNMLCTIMTYKWTLEDWVCIRIFYQQTTTNVGQLGQNKGLYWKYMGQLMESSELLHVFPRKSYPMRLHKGWETCSLKAGKRISCLLFKELPWEQSALALSHSWGTLFKAQTLSTEIKSLGILIWIMWPPPGRIEQNILIVRYLAWDKMGE